MNDPRDPDFTRGKKASRRYEAGIVVVLAVILVALWILSLAGVRARLAARAWNNGDVAGAYRLAAMATRQRPEMADMWLLQARCEERLWSPCEAALSYARAVLAANEQEAQDAAVAGGNSPGSATPVADPPIHELRAEALAGALKSAASCPSIATPATVFEALTVGLPSDPQQRDGYWPGQPEIAAGRETALSVADALPDDAALRLRWIEFLWRRDERAAARAAAQPLLATPVEVPAAGLSLLGDVLLDAGDLHGAERAFRRALAVDPGWVPAAVGLAAVADDVTATAAGNDDRSPAGSRQLPAGAGQTPSDSATVQAWREQALPLASAAVDAAVWELRDEGLLLATNGSVSFTVEPTGGGRAFLALEVWGTPANGRYPEISPSLDGVAAPSLEATDRRLPITVEIRGAGATTVTFTFGNDWADAGGDRNVFFGPPTLYRSDR